MGSRPIRKSSIAWAVLFALSCFCLALFVWTSFGGTTPLFARGYRFHAEFDQATNLAPNADVRISGISVGKVVQVTPSSGLTDAVIELQPSFAPLATDARAILRSKTLLGEAFIQLLPGTQTAPKLPDNGRLAVANVEATQPIDRVLAIFDARTREALKQFLLGTAASLKGRGAQLNDAIGNTQLTLVDLDQLVTILDQEGSSVHKLISEGGAAFQALGARSADLQSIVTAGQQVFQATAARNAALIATVRALPPFIDALRPTVTAVETTALDAAPALHPLRAVAPLLRPALEHAVRLTPQLTALFKALNPFITHAANGIQYATALLAPLKPLGVALDAAGAQLVPLVQLLSLYDRETVATIANGGAAAEATTMTPSGPIHYIRPLSTTLNESAGGDTQRLGTNRYDPYYLPGGLANIVSGLRSFDCRNATNPVPVPVFGGGGAPQCLLQAPWIFQGAKRSYPNVVPNTAHTPVP